MRLRILPFSFTSGLFAGTHLALITLFLLFKGTPGQTISRLGRLLPGFEFSPVGALVGFGWLFLAGMAVGLLISVLYNVFLGDAVGGGERPPKTRAPKPTKARTERKPRKPKREKLPRAAKPAKEKPPKTRTPKQAPQPKRHKTPYPGKVGAYKQNQFGSYRYSA
ncbi:hypothetical protein KQI63_12680 [bacterium]|nr:hypothetical protein [bacterium]